MEASEMEEDKRNRGDNWDYAEKLFLVELIRENREDIKK